MEQTVFNQAQMKLLRMMSFVNTQKELENLESAISQYFAQKVDDEIDALCANGEITLETIDNWGNEHMRSSK